MFDLHVELTRLIETLSFATRKREMEYNISARSILFNVDGSVKRPSVACLKTELGFDSDIVVSGGQCVMVERGVFASEHYTSKTCGNCGSIHTKLGSNKVFKCPTCDFITDRDINGARNILLRSIRRTNPRGDV